MRPNWHSLTDKRMTYNLIGLFSDQYRMRGSEFAELKAFAAVVERASFTQAADHLGLSPSAPSQTIRQLEGRLGVRLLNRTTRSVAPTTAGSRLHERIAPMILEMDAAVAEAVVTTGRTAGTLRINTLGMAAKDHRAAAGPLSPGAPRGGARYRDRRWPERHRRGSIRCRHSRRRALRERHDRCRGPRAEARHYHSNVKRSFSVTYL